MLIRVRYADNHYDMIRPEILNRLLEKGSVESFLRSDGWVIPGSGALRSAAKSGYSGPERRMRRELERRGAFL